MPAVDAASRHAKPGVAVTPSSASEETPLLRSADSTDLSIPFADDGSQGDDDASSRRKPSDDGAVEPTITPIRGVGVAVNLWLLIFLQGMSFEGEKQ